jgi:flagellar hook-basal body complex protein FliE
MLPILNAISAAAGPFSLSAGATAGTVFGGAAPTPSGLATTGSTPFASLITDAVGQVGQLEDGARAAMTGLMTGTGVDVHQAMIATEKASMSFELALAVRNKAVQAYQQVIGMQF